MRPRERLADSAHARRHCSLQHGQQRSNHAADVAHDVDCRRTLRLESGQRSAHFAQRLRRELSTLSKRVLGLQHAELIRRQLVVRALSVSPHRGRHAVDIVARRT